MLLLCLQQWYTRVGNQHRFCEKKWKCDLTHRWQLHTIGILAMFPSKIPGGAILIILELFIYLSRQSQWHYKQIYNKQPSPALLRLVLYHINNSDEKEKNLCIYIAHRTSLKISCECKQYNLGIYNLIYYHLFTYMWMTVTATIHFVVAQPEQGFNTNLTILQKI